MQKIITLRINAPCLRCRWLPHPIAHLRERRIKTCASMMNYALEMMNSALKMMNYALKMVKLPVKNSNTSPSTH